MGRACSIHIHIQTKPYRKGRDHLRDLTLHGRIILKQVLRNRTYRCALGSYEEKKILFRSKGVCGHLGVRECRNTLSARTSIYFASKTVLLGVDQSVSQEIYLLPTPCLLNTIHRKLAVAELSIHTHK